MGLLCKPLSVLFDGLAKAHIHRAQARTRRSRKNSLKIRFNAKVCRGKESRLCALTGRIRATDGGGTGVKNPTRPQPPTGGEGERERRDRTTEGWPKTSAGKAQPTGTRLLAPLVTVFREGGRLPAPRPTRDGRLFRPEVHSKNHKNISKRHDVI